MQSLQMFGQLTPQSLPKAEASAIPVTQEPELFIKDTTQKGKDRATRELNKPYTYYTKFVWCKKQKRRP